MIRSLRSRHRVLVVGVGLVAALLGVAGLLARRPVPAMDLPPVLIEREEARAGAAREASPPAVDPPRARSEEAGVAETDPDPAGARP